MAELISDLNEDYEDLVAQRDGTKQKLKKQNQKKQFDSGPHRQFSILDLTPNRHLPVFFSIKLNLLIICIRQTQPADFQRRPVQRSLQNSEILN